MTTKTAVGRAVFSAKKSLPTGRQALGYYIPPYSG